MLFSFVLLTLMSAMLFGSVAAQQPAQLSLADILIALRSKKVTLAERNKLIGDAVKTRGITFALTPEIEKELQTTGADPVLIGALRTKIPDEKIAQNTSLRSLTDPVTMPVSAPAPPDFSFYQKRGDGSLAKGDPDSAIADYSKAIELRSMEPSAYLNRGVAYLNKKSYDLSILDFSKVIELEPARSVAYLNRGNAFEKKGEIQKALTDFQKAADLDPNNDAAKASVQRLQTELAKLNAPPVQTPPQTVAADTKPKETVSAPVVEAPKAPQSLNIGAAMKNQAVKLIMPVYSVLDKQRNLQGVVTVEITLDEKGEVTEAKGTTGPKTLRSAAEDAARRTKFKPALSEGRPIKSSGFINYNFVVQ
ncbi:MAG TPA: TonB family protein [Pyrinomonadaceae bacterium]|jgi:TonB family protein|nr:TonB family protein [Pyrinomonadaceae bacterium]